MSGAAGAEVFDAVNSNVDRAQYGAPVYGQNHLLGGEFRVPPGLFVRKFLLLEKKERAATAGIARLLCRPRRKLHVSAIRVSHLEI